MSDLLTELLHQAREEVGRADTKASIILGACGVGVAAFLGGVVSDSWKPGVLPNCIEWIWWIGALTFLAGIVASTRCLWPSTKIPNTSMLPSYYQRIAQFDDAESLRKTLGSSDPDEILSEQLLAISRIADAKYRYLQFSLGAVTVGGIVVTVAVVLGDAFG